MHKILHVKRTDKYYIYKIVIHIYYYLQRLQIVVINS